MLLEQKQQQTSLKYEKHWQLRISQQAQIKWYSNKNENENENVFLPS